MNQSVENPESTTFAEAMESGLDFRTPEKGDLLKGTIVSISGDDAFVTYGGPTEAIIDVAEIDEKELGDEVEEAGPLEADVRDAMQPTVCFLGAGRRKAEDVRRHSQPDFHSRFFV